MKGDFSRFTFQSAKHYSGVRLQQGRVQLDADWNEQVDIQAHRGETTTRDVLGPCSGPFQEAGFAITITNNGNNLIIGPGRYYVNGILCVNDGPVLFTAQPDLPGEPLPTEDGTYLAYLDMWQRHLTALEDPGIREVALGGPDTATRTKTLCQVKMEAVDENAICSQFGPDWKPISTQSTGQLKARAKPGGPSEGPCIVPAGAGFRRLENQLYRVEIHTPGQAGTASFKWSRDNGVIMARLSKINGKELTVSTPVKDAVLGFAAGHWVELSDEGRTLRCEPGFLVQLTSVAGDTLTVKDWPNGNPLTLKDDLGALPTVRRWDSESPTGEILVASGAFIELENGVEIEFAEGDYRTGDYWLIPARSLSGDVEWPQDESLEPLFEPRHGIERHYCPLALLRLDGQIWSPSNDCRTFFLPLTEQRGEGEPGIHIMAVQFLESGQPSLRNDRNVPADQLAKGIQVVCDQIADPQAIEGKPTCFVTLHLPYPFNNVDSQLWGSAVIGFQPLILAADASAKGGSISWIPTEATRTWLEQRLFTEMERLKRGDRLLARLTLKGNFIWARDNPAVYLDGEAFGEPGGQHTELRLRSGDGGPGGDFKMWFWVVKPRGSAPDIDVTPTTLDFGDLPLTQSKELELTVRNTGLVDPLNIIKIDISPSPPFSAPPPGPPIRAGESVKVKVRFEPKAGGVQTGALTINSNDPDERERTVQLRGVGLRPGIEVTPTSLNFDINIRGFRGAGVIVGNVTIQQLTVKNTGSTLLTVNSMVIVSGSPHFNVVSSTGPINPNSQRRVDVHFAPKAAGVQTGALSITSNDPDEPTITVQLQGTGLAPKIDVTPSALNFGNVTVGQSTTADQDLTVKNTGSAQLNVNIRISNNTALFSVLTGGFRVAAGGSVTVKVRFAPKTKSTEPEKGTLTINSNDPDERERPVELQGVGVVPEIGVDLDPSILNFGTTIRKGESGELSFNVINKSSDALLSVASINRSGSNRFRVVSPTGAFTVAADVTQIVTVSFEPKNTALQKGTLTINSNDPNRPQLIVSLQGTGR